MNPTLIQAAVLVAAVLVLLAVARKVQLRLELSRAKHRSLAGHSKISRRLARFVPDYEYSPSEVFRVDSPPAEVAAAREAGFTRLTELFAQRSRNTAQVAAEIATSLSD